MRHQPITAAKQEPFILLVDRILKAKASDTAAHTTEQEAEIDRLVFRLYTLTDHKIVIIGGKSND